MSDLFGGTPAAAGQVHSAAGDNRGRTFSIYENQSDKCRWRSQQRAWRPPVRGDPLALHHGNAGKSRDHGLSAISI
jgi:hypothetical protein